MKHLLSAAFILALVLATVSAARAQEEISLLAPTPMQEPLKKILPGFEAKTNYKVSLTIGHGVDTRRQIARGEMFDVSILLPPFPEAVASGNIVPSSKTVLAGLTLALGVKKGAPKPDISTPEALKKTLFAAKTVSYVDPTLGSAGVAAVNALQNLGIIDMIDSKIKIGATGGVPQDFVVKGEADICLVYLSDMRNPGVDPVGLLPRKVSPPMEITGFISTHAKDAKAAKALLDYLASPPAEAVYKADLMEAAH